MPPPAMSVNVPETDEAKQDRLRKRRERDRIGRERKTPEKRDARFVNALPMCLPHILIISYWFLLVIWDQQTLPQH